MSVSFYFMKKQPGLFLVCLHCEARSFEFLSHLDNFLNQLKASL